VRKPGGIGAVPQVRLEASKSKSNRFNSLAAQHIIIVYMLVPNLSMSVFRRGIRITRITTQRLKIKTRFLILHAEAAF